MSKEKEQLKYLGYDEELENWRDEMGLADFSVARVIAEHKELYIVKNLQGEFQAKVTGKRIFDAKGREDFPAVGDWVAIEKIDGEKAVIQAILPRKTMIKTTSSKHETQIIAANIDVAFIVGAINRDFSINRFERYLVLAREGKIEPVIVLNKIDLISSEELHTKVEDLKKRFSDVKILATSIEADGGMDELMESIEDKKTYCFLGSSGVGKSSLINKLLHEEVIYTQQISQVTDRGKHTTTAREMYFLKNGGILIDNPGIREVGIGEAESGIESVFEEVGALSEGCRFSDCTHANEPGCAVRKAIEEKELNERKFENFTKLKKESDFYKMSNQEKREKDRKFGKFVKKTIEKLDKYS